MDETKQTVGTTIALYSAASELVKLPLVEPVKQTDSRAPQPGRKPSKPPSKKDTVTISSEALQLARDGAAVEDE